MELPEPKLISLHNENNELSPYSEIVESLKQEIANLRVQLQEANNKICFLSNQKIFEEEETITECKVLESPESHIEIDCDLKYGDVDIKYSNIVPIHRTNLNSNTAPVTKVAERIKLKRATDAHRNVNPNDLVNSDLSTAVAEHIVGDILRQCDAQNEKQSVDIDLRRLNAKLDHARSQNSVLAITLTETKAHCDR